MSNINKSIIALQIYYSKNRNKIRTEEDTKRKLIEKFFTEVLGYDEDDFSYEFNVGDLKKRGDYVDLVINKSKKPLMLVECKHRTEDLDNHIKQLKRYMDSTENEKPAQRSNIGVLSNGIEYRFYTDLNGSKKMNTTPMFSFSINNEKSIDYHKLELLKKENYNEDVLIEEAKQDFVTNLFHITLENMQSGKIHSDTLAFFRRSLEFKIFGNNNEKYTYCINKAANKFIKEGKTKKHNENIITTGEELEAFTMVKTLAGASSKIDVAKIIYEDAKSYFAIKYVNKRQTFCKLFLFDTKQSYFEVSFKNKDSEKFPIDNINDLTHFASKIKKAAESFAV